MQEEIGESSSSSKIKKVPKHGIIYLSTIPPYMNVTKIREYFEEFGTVGRVYLQLADAGKDAEQEKVKKKRKRKDKYSEGWVEFERKATAKKVAEMVNNQQVSSRKGSKMYDSTWTIKYLSNFKWTHLNERLIYEHQARKQKLLTEVQSAKKKTNFFTLNLDKKKNNIKLENNELTDLQQNQIEFKSGETNSNAEDRTEFLQNLFQ